MPENSSAARARPPAEISAKVSGKVSLAHLTALQLSPPDLVHLAHRTGYDAVGLRLNAVVDTSPGYNLWLDRPMLRATKAALATTGLDVIDIEFLRVSPDIDYVLVERMLAAGAEIGARHLITAPYDEDRTRMVDSLGKIGELCARYGIYPVLEFFTWTTPADIRSALEVIEAVGPERLGLLVDALHFDRSSSSFEDLRALPAALIPFVHVCDAPAVSQPSLDDLLRTARESRLPPGHGDIDLTRFLDALPETTILTLEAPTLAETLRHGHEHVARNLRESLRANFGI